MEKAVTQVGVINPLFRCYPDCFRSEGCPANLCAPCGRIVPQRAAEKSAAGPGSETNLAAADWPRVTARRCGRMARTDSQLLHNKKYISLFRHRGHVSIFYSWRNGKLPERPKKRSRVRILDALPTMPRTLLRVSRV